MTKEKIIKKPFIEIILFTSVQFAILAGVGYSSEVLLPVQIRTMVGEENKEITLGIITAISTFGICAFAVISGIICDLFSIQYPIIIIGSIIFALSFFLRTFLINPWWMIFPHGLLEIIGKCFLGLSAGAFSSLVPKLFPDSQLGSVGGFSGFFNLFGQFFASSAIGLAFNFLSPIIWSFILCIFVISSIIPLLLSKFIDAIAISRSKKYEDLENNSNEDQLTGEENDLEEKNDESQYDDILMDKPLVEDEDDIVNGNKSIPKKTKSILLSIRNWFSMYKLYILVVLANLLAVYSQSLGLDYYLYFLEDIVAKDGNYNIFIPWINDNIKDAVQARGLLNIIVLIFSLFSSFIFGILSGFIKSRVLLAIISNTLITFSKAINIVTLNYNFMIISGVFQGLGMGLFNGVIYALVNELLPTDKKNAGRDLAIATFFITGSYIISSLSGGLFLYLSRLIFGGNLFGFYTIFLVGAICCILANIVLIFIPIVQNGSKTKKTRPKSIKLKDEIYDTL